MKSCCFTVRPHVALFLPIALQSINLNRHGLRDEDLAPDQQ
jgi:hypothetical protein